MEAAWRGARTGLWADAPSSRLSRPHLSLTSRRAACTLGDGLSSPRSQLQSVLSLKPTNQQALGPSEASCEPLGAEWRLPCGPQGRPERR